MSKRTQTTYTFRSKEAADLFEWWLSLFSNSLHVGSPLFVDKRAVGGTEWCVEYSYERDFATGVATGIDLGFRTAKVLHPEVM